MLLAITILALATVASATQCPPPGSVRYMVPHETDCSKFYICAHGVPLLQSCPEGTHFNSNFMVCQNPVFAGCSNQLPESELECSWPDSILFRPHPDSCSKYYVCEFGTPLVFDCAQGTEFNAELKECVWPHESNCNIEARPDAPENNTDNSQNGGSQDGGCSEGALSAHSDCGRYNICNHGALVAMDCAPGLQWSSKVEQCVWPHESDCNSSSEEVQTIAPENEPQNGGSQEGSSQDDGCEEGALSAHSDCGRYNICNHGALVAMDCAPRLEWSSILEQCVWPSESDCHGGLPHYQTEAPENEPQSSSSQEGSSQESSSQDGGCEEGALSAHSDCGRYNICNHGALVAMDCAPGLQWSSKVEQCVWPNESDCNYDDGQPEAPENEPQDGSSEVGSSQEGSSDASGCEEGALSANVDCNKYNKCNHGVNVAMDCPPGLHWNSILQHCDWPLTAGCA